MTKILAHLLRANDTNTATNGQWADLKVHLRFADFTQGKDLDLGVSVTQHDGTLTFEVDKPLAAFAKGRFWLDLEIQQDPPPPVHMLPRAICETTIREADIYLGQLVVSKSSLNGGGPVYGVPEIIFSSVVAPMAYLMAYHAERIKSMEEALGGNVVSMEEAFVDATKQVTAARDSVSKAGMKLGNVSLNLRFLALPGGLAQFLPKSALETISPAALGALSGATLDIGLPPPPPTADAEMTPVPSVIDYTELLARRKLQGSSFYVATNTEIVPPPKPGKASKEGRVVRQLPGAGEVVKRESVVQLFIGREAKVEE